MFSRITIVQEDGEFIVFFFVFICQLVCFLIFYGCCVQPVVSMSFFPNEKWCVHFVSPIQRNYGSYLVLFPRLIWYTLDGEGKKERKIIGRWVFCYINVNWIALICENRIDLQLNLIAFRVFSLTVLFNFRLNWQQIKHYLAIVKQRSPPI